jgi:monoamine oxidase
VFGVRATGEVIVLEAQMRPGGRVRTLRECFAAGLYGEAGAEVEVRSSEPLQQQIRYQLEMADVASGYGVPLLDG